jgi:hypothetical protein
VVLLLVTRSDGRPARSGDTPTPPARLGFAPLVAPAGGGLIVGGSF